jgi:DNA-binding protein H-NS
MTDMNKTIDSLPLEALLSWRDQIDARIRDMAAAELGALRDRIAQLEPYVEGKAPEKAAPKKVRAKYRDPATGVTWTGRGRMPLWLCDYEKAGKARADFEIRQPG